MPLLRVRHIGDPECDGNAAADERDGQLDAVPWAWLQCGWVVCSPNALAVTLITSAAAIRALSTRLRLETRAFLAIDVALGGRFRRTPAGSTP